MILLQCCNGLCPQNGRAEDDSGLDEGGEETSAVGGERQPGTARKRPQKIS